MNMALPSNLPHNKLLKQYRFKKVVGSLIATAIVLGIIIVPVEIIYSDTPLIQNPFDGVWWAVTTVTTVGYGDVVPITVPGRMIGMVLQLIGALLFGSLIGIVSVYLTRAQTEYRWRRMFERFDALENEIKSLKKQNNFLVKDTDEKKSDEKYDI